MKEPRDPLTRYAYGYTDQKPPLSYWIMIGLLVGFVLYNAITIAW